MKRSATAVWIGPATSGAGRVSTASGGLRSQPVTLATRFEDEDGRSGTTPEELVAAAHAGCFSMALAVELQAAECPAEWIEARADLTVVRRDGGLSVTGVTMRVVGRVPGIPAGTFSALADQAAAACPVSRLLGVRVTVDARLAGPDEHPPRGG